MKKIMILGASILQLPAIKKAKEMGLEVVVVDMNPDAVGFQTEGIEKEIMLFIKYSKDKRKLQELTSQPPPASAHSSSKQPGSLTP